MLIYRGTRVNEYFYCTLCVYMFVYAQRCACICMCECVHEYVNACICTCVFVHIWVYLGDCVRVCLTVGRHSVYRFVHVFTCAVLYVCLTYTSLISLWSILCSA